MSFHYIDGNPVERFRHRVWKPEEKRIMNRAIVTFSGPDGTYHVYLPDSGVSSNVSKALAASASELKKSNVSPLTASELASEFLTQVRGKTGTRARVGHDCGEMQNAADYQYIVASDNWAIQEVQVYTRSSGYNTGQLFKGTLSNWLTVADADTELLSTLDKVVKFTYKAGSHPNSSRIVKVAKVTGKGLNQRLEGTDVEKGEYRAYLRKHIVGKVAVLSD